MKDATMTDTAHSMTNEELSQAIEKAFQLTQRIATSSAIYTETVKHYYMLLGVQQKRAAA